MIIGALQIELFLPAPQSLKAKRFILKGLRERIRAKFNVSISEIDHHDLWQRSLLGVGVVGTEKRHINAVLDSVLNLIRTVPGVELCHYHIELM